MPDHTEENSKRPDAQVPEVPEKASRRRFDAAYKLRILEEADRCSEPGQLGELLRREGLYSSHLTTWRKQRDEGALNGLREKKRGRKPRRRDAKELELARLRREKQELEERLRQAETIIEVQKKVSEILGIPLDRPDDENT
jgi:transposase-like protein